jgi:hypothetical protein
VLLEILIKIHSGFTAVFSIKAGESFWTGRKGRSFRACFGELLDLGLGPGAKAAVNLEECSHSTFYLCFRNPARIAPGSLAYCLDELFSGTDIGDSTKRTDCNGLGFVVMGRTAILDHDTAVSIV